MDAYVAAVTRQHVKTHPNPVSIQKVLSDYLAWREKSGPAWRAKAARSYEKRRKREEIEEAKRKAAEEARQELERAKGAARERLKERHKAKLAEQGIVHRGTRPGRPCFSPIESMNGVTGYGGLCHLRIRGAALQLRPGWRGQMQTASVSSCHGCRNRCTRQTLGSGCRSS